MIARCGLALAALLSITGLSSATCAAQAIALEPSCEGVVVGFDAALSVELVDRAEELSSSLEATMISLACDEDAVTVRVSDTASERFIGQRVERVERGLVRQLAIVAAELLSALASQHEAPDPIVESAPTEAPEPRSRAFIVGVRLAGSVAGAGTPLSAFGGGALGLELDPIDLLRVVVDASVAHTRTSTGRGDIDSTTLALAVSLRFGAPLGAVWLGLGPFARGGVVFFSGQPSGGGITGRDAVLPWLALGAVASMAVSIEGTPLAIELDLEGGGLPLTSIALVDGAPGFDLGPAFFGAQLGLALRFT